MGILTGVVFPIVLWGIAWMIGRREMMLYQAAHDHGDDLFVYTKGRLYRRMTGVGVLVALGLTLLLMELWPASSGRGISLYFAIIMTEVAALIALPILDLRETSRTARPEDLKRRAETDRQKRSRSDRPR
jgi:hypothetical protein